MRGRREGVKLWLDRSGSLPLTLSVSIGAFNDVPVGPVPRGLEGDVEVNIVDLSTQLATYSHRWKSVKVSHIGDQKATDAICRPLTQLKEKDFPILEELDAAAFCFFRYEHDATTQTLTPTPTNLARVLTRLPSLRTLHLANERACGILALSGGSWASLTTLFLNSISVHSPTEAGHTVEKLAQLGPSLNFLSFNPILSHWLHIGMETPLYTPVQFPLLRTLIVKVGSDHLYSNAIETEENVSKMLIAILRNIHAPALESLHAGVGSGIAIYNAEQEQPENSPPSSSRDPYDGFSVPFHRLLSQSHGRITHLSMGGFPLARPEMLAQSLELLPSLQFLTFSGTRSLGSDGDDINEVLRVSTYTTFLSVLRKLLSSDPLLCQDLENLEVERQEPPSTVMIPLVDPILDLALSRSKLKALSVDFGELPKANITGLEANVRAHRALGELREGRGVHVSWKWEELREPDISFYDEPYA
ncbi:hypothetical protein V5O48_012746 [Marasmius crinis-equi]|uniref:Uncharacterized protein n=1 Tax=Marasmius crinis-equi TaxID=585013 RepID=A0ABR3F1Z1_9AGAR